MYTSCIQICVCIYVYTYIHTSIDTIYIYINSLFLSLSLSFSLSPGFKAARMGIRGDKNGAGKDLPGDGVFGFVGGGPVEIQ